MFEMALKIGRIEWSAQPRVEEIADRLNGFAAPSWARALNCHYLISITSVAQTLPYRRHCTARVAFHKLIVK